MTRRARNQAASDGGARAKDGSPLVSPPLIVPALGAHLWRWFFDLSRSIRRVSDGVCNPVPPSEFQAWCRSTGNIVRPAEYAILCAMDAEFCVRTNVELAEYQERRDAERETNAPKPRRR